MSDSPPFAGDGADHARSSLSLQSLFHCLNNQLGIVLAHSELLEAKAGDATDRARAAQIVTSTLGAMSTVREIRLRTEREAG